MRRFREVPFAFASSCALALLALPLPGRGETEPSPPEGLYEVEGSTTVVVTGAVRSAAGKVVLALDEDGRYITSFNLKTVLPTAEGPRAVDITGSGQGAASEGVLTGTAEAQWLAAAIPGLDPQFAFIPGRLGPRIQSRFMMRPATGRDRGRYHVEIHSEGLAGPAGQGYSPTTTVLEAVRVGEKPSATRLPLPRPRDD